jgi:hypothetical protein
MLLPAEVWLAVALSAETLGTLTLPELCGICIHHNSQSLVDIMTEHSPWFQKCKRLSTFFDCLLTLSRLLCTLLQPLSGAEGSDEN